MNGIIVQNHLRLADDIVLIRSDIHELKDMLKKLNEASKKKSRPENEPISKTKIISDAE